jgi:hypothetical protein
MRLPRRAPAPRHRRSEDGLARPPKCENVHRGELRSAAPQFRPPECADRSKLGERGEPQRIREPSRGAAPASLACANVRIRDESLRLIRQKCDCLSVSGPAVLAPILANVIRPEDVTAVATTNVDVRAVGPWNRLPLPTPGSSTALDWRTRSEPGGGRRESDAMRCWRAKRRGGLGAYLPARVLAGRSLGEPHPRFQEGPPLSGPSHLTMRQLHSTPGSAPPETAPRSLVPRACRAGTSYRWPCTSHRQ